MVQLIVGPLPAEETESIWMRLTAAAGVVHQRVIVVGMQGERLACMEPEVGGRVMVRAGMAHRELSR